MLGQKEQSGASNVECAAGAARSGAAASGRAAENSAWVGSAGAAFGTPARLRWCERCAQRWPERPRRPAAPTGHARGAARPLRHAPATRSPTPGIAAWPGSGRGQGDPLRTWRAGRVVLPRQSGRHLAQLLGPAALAGDPRRPTPPPPAARGHQGNRRAAASGDWARRQTGWAEGCRPSTGATTVAPRWWSCLGARPPGEAGRRLAGVAGSNRCYAIRPLATPTPLDSFLELRYTRARQQAMTWCRKHLQQQRRVVRVDERGNQPRWGESLTARRTRDA